VALPPPFEDLSRAKGVPVIWKGRAISLKASPEAEFFISEFVRRGGLTRIPSSSGKLSASLFGSKSAADAFWKDWKALLPSGCPIASLEELDVSNVIRSIASKQPVRNGPSKAPKNPYEFARVNGRLQPVAPSSVDRPGIFFGRSDDVKATLNGRIRRRIVAEDVTINLSENARVPSVPVGCGKKWKEVVHDPEVDWIASWRDPVTEVMKYSRLATASESEQIGTREKYDLAKKMNAMTPVLRKRIAAAMGSSDRKRRQLGAVLWLVDRLALRVGSGNAESAKKAGAHGVATLMVKHVKVIDRHTIYLSFPGKDCVTYDRTIPGVPSELVHIITESSRRKDAEDALFESVDSNDAASAIDSVVSGATAKVLRTARASELFGNTLDSMKVSDTQAAKLLLLFAFTRAAILLNHRKAAPKRRSKKDKSVELGGGDLAELDRKVDALMKDFEHVENKQDLSRIGKKLREDVVRSANLSLATARGSYLDPRIVFEFGRKNGLTEQESGGATFAKKFPWATSKHSI
jgi:DNA topoisomerase IB